MIGAGPQFEKKYRIPPQGANMDDEFFDSRFKDIDLRIVGLEEQLGSYDTAVDALIQRGLDQINTQLQAAIGAVQTDVESVESAVVAINTSIAELEEAIASIVSGALPASSVTLAPIVGLAASNAQEALTELHAEIDALGGNVASLQSTKAPLASPGFTNIPTAPTAAAGTNTNQIATTAFVVAAVATAVAALRNGVSATLDTLAEVAVELGLKAPLASPGFTGIPTAPTAAAGTNTNQIATTAFVQAGLAGREVADADILKSDVTKDLGVGYTSTSKDQGTKSSGTFAPAFSAGSFQHFVCNGAFTLGVPTGHGSMILDHVNGATAGVVTRAGFTKVTGDPITTTTGHKFRHFITTGQQGSHCHTEQLP